MIFSFKYLLQSTALLCQPQLLKGTQWLFLQCWRVKHCPNKVKDFLCGKKIPLHLRNDVPIIHVSGAMTMVAVKVEDNRWIIDASFDPTTVEGNRVRLIA